MSDWLPPWPVALMGLAASCFAWWLHGCATVPLEPRECAPMPDIGQEFAQLVLDAEAILGPVSKECAEQVQGIEIVDSPEDMPEVCWRSNGTVLGCQALDHLGFSHVYILACQRNPRDTIRMERAHALLGCLGIPDKNHEHPIWERLKL